MLDKAKIIQSVMMTNNIDLVHQTKQLFAEYEDITVKIEHYDSLSEEEKIPYYEQFMNLYNSKKRIESDINWLLNIKNSKPSII